jgi:FtsP/CotA-like multicopper oxidase with cupredoxin domain
MHFTRSFYYTALIAFSFLSALPAWAKTVEYELHLREEIVNYTGRDVRALTVNNSLPAPTLEFTEGDDAKITVVNHLKENSSVHWHGLLVPNDQDGVPGVTYSPIKGGTSFTYRFPIKQSGTYWYHSHTNLQEQRGLYGAIIIHPKSETIKADKEMVLVLSDWTDESPEQVLRNLRTDGSYYALKKKTTVSWWDAIKRKKFLALLKIEKGRMGPMDLSDVGYDAFLSNGKKEQSFPDLKPGEKLRLRVVNASSSTYFHLGFGGERMTVISADGKDVKPTEVKQALIAVAETYDFLITLPKAGSFEFRATSQDVTGKTSLFIGTGDRVLAPNIPLPDALSQMTMPMPGMPGMPMSSSRAAAEPCDPGEVCDAPILDYSMLESLEPTTLPSASPTREIVLNLEGDMERYVWLINGKTLSEADKILVYKGENIRFKLVNKTMMHHPMHLHGHFFRLINGAGDNAPLKHTVDVPPMGTVSIEFAANEEKDWFFHCHNLYHMVSGMARIVSYGPTDHNGTMFGHEKHIGEKLMAKADVTAQTNELTINGSVFEAHQIIEVNVEYQPNAGKTDLMVNYVRPQNQFKGNFASVGVDFERDQKAVPYIVGGIRRLLPYLVDVRVGVMGMVRDGPKVTVYLALDRKIQLTDRVTLNPSFEFIYNQPKFRFNVMYTINPRTYMIGGYNTDNRVQPFGVGIRKRL